MSEILQLLVNHNENCKPIMLQNDAQSAGTGRGDSLAKVRLYLATEQKTTLSLKLLQSKGFSPRFARFYRNFNECSPCLLWLSA